MKAVRSSKEGNKILNPIVSSSDKEPMLRHTRELERGRGRGREREKETKMRGIRGIEGILGIWGNNENPQW